MPRAASPELQERERTKFAAVTDALADALQRRGAAGSGARLLAHVGAAIFQAAFERWNDQPEHAGFSACVREAATELAASLGAVDIAHFQAGSGHGDGTARQDLGQTWVASSSERCWSICGM